MDKDKYLGLWKAAGILLRVMTAVVERAGVFALARVTAEVIEGNADLLTQIDCMDNNVFTSCTTLDPVIPARPFCLYVDEIYGISGGGRYVYMTVGDMPKVGVHEEDLMRETEIGSFAYRR